MSMGVGGLSRRTFDTPSRDSRLTEKEAANLLNSALKSAGIRDLEAYGNRDNKLSPNETAEVRKLARAIHNTK